MNIDNRICLIKTYTKRIKEIEDSLKVLTDRFAIRCARQRLKFAKEQLNKAHRA